MGENLIQPSTRLNLALISGLVFIPPSYISNKPKRRVGVERKMFRLDITVALAPFFLSLSPAGGSRSSPKMEIPSCNILYGYTVPRTRVSFFAILIGPGGLSRRFARGLNSFQTQLRGCLSIVSGEDGASNRVRIYIYVFVAVAFPPLRRSYLDALAFSFTSPLRLFPLVHFPQRAGLMAL